MYYKYSDKEHMQNWRYHHKIQLSMDMFRLLECCHNDYDQSHILCRKFKFLVVNIFYKNGDNLSRSSFQCQNNLANKDRYQEFLIY